MKNSCIYDRYTRALCIGQARGDGIDRLYIETGAAVYELSPE